ncbi:MAG: hypothetical protein HUU20_21340 [Pirellulales bacterium]|nr:hypothetical protein [Pirellulales bacterium]
MKTFSGCAWVVFIEPPPTENADPERVLKCLARYLTGGPISDRLLMDHRDGNVTCWARGYNKHKGNLIRASDVLHHQEIVAERLARIEGGDDVGVDQPSGCLHFALEPHSSWEKDRLRVSSPFSPFSPV